MSHYVVAVLTKEHPDEADFYEILAKFDENITVPRYVSLTKEQIIEKKKKEYQEYKEGLYADYLKDPEGYRAKCKNDAHMVYISDTFPNVILKMNDEEIYQNFIKDIPTKDEIEYDEQEYIDEDGNLTSTYNPLSKWDWWSLGGRWSGELPLKNGKGADWGKVSDVAWGNDIIPEEYIKEHPEVKSEYERLITEGGSWYNAEYYKKTYPTIEQYIKNKVSFVPFAILMPDGIWYEKGRMGWFGMSSETFDEAIEWYENFYDKFIKDYQDYYVTLIDCHI
jgi:hypothetical protein